MARDSFDEFFKRMMKQFLKDLEAIEKEGISKRQIRREKFPEFVVRKPGGMERRSGFSISFSSNGVSPPKIEMNRFGPSGAWEKVPLEKRELAPIAKTRKEKLIIQPKVKPPEKVALSEVKEKVIPDYNVSVDIKEVTITLAAEGVEKKENVEIKFYPESIEIYATSPKLNKGYFCTIAVPASINKQGATIEVEKKRVIIKIPRKFSVV